MERLGDSVENLEQIIKTALVLGIDHDVSVRSAAEFPFDHYNYMFGRLPSGTDANGQTPSHDHDSSSSSDSGASDGGGD
ncbi:hypothetical protein [Paenibacillus sp. JJ-100]|uniref:hypothetical protein n=1 Tax=Paenibacillus sp. JJ-100 TaxID=2974896 RepID=UPI00232AC5F6|nr:hypothetical protein [Paenibacillus sp. JJ-100]